MDNDNVVSVLNSLIKTSRDGEQGFRKAAEDTNDTSLKTLFSTRAQGCASAVTELEQLVAGLGGSPETSGSVAGALHRGWLDVKSAVTGRDDLAILQECERGEDVAKSTYSKAVADTTLPPEIRAVVEKQYQGVLSNHDKIRDLRNQYASAKDAAKS
jgi:uncharacterized protein (TIGR02284 family)